MNLLAEFYGREEAMRGLIRRLAADPAALALDAGCKKGDVARPLSGVVGRLVAIDRVCFREWGAARGAGLSFVNGDAQALPFKPDVFDTVVACESLHYMEDTRRALAEFRRVLKPGGRLILSFPERSALTGAFNPYNVALALKRMLGCAAPGRRRITYLRAADVLACCPAGWTLENHFRRGTMRFVYAAWLAENLQAARLWLRRLGAPGAWAGEALLKPLIRAGGAAMNADFARTPPHGGYNNIIVLRREKIDSALEKPRLFP